MTTRLLNFKAVFAPMVESGRKPHTIRALRKDGNDPLPGDTLHLYTGLRTKAVRLLRREVCDYTRDIMIQPSSGNVHHVLLGGQPLSQDELNTLARVDGFADANDFIRYFDTTHGLPFTGVLIGWQPSPLLSTHH